MDIGHTNSFRSRLQESILLLEMTADKMNIDLLLGTGLRLLSFLAFRRGCLVIEIKRIYYRDKYNSNKVRDAVNLCGCY